VGKIRIHLHDDIEAGVQGTPEGEDVGSSQSQFTGAMDDLDAGILGSQRICHATSSIRRVVVNDPDGGLGQLGADSGDDGYEIVAFVVRG
jgi:hypothetical protein